MKIGYIDFPEELLDAQQNGKLVVFAGAGVVKDSNADHEWQETEYKMRTMTEVCSS